MQTNTTTHRERKKIERKALIVETLFDLSAERGFSNVTVEELAAACNISRRTFFNYFDSKEDALLGQLSCELSAEEYAKLQHADNLTTATLELLMQRHWGKDSTRFRSVDAMKKLKATLEAEPELLETFHIRMSSLRSNIVEAITEIFIQDPQRQATELSPALEAELIIAAISGCFQALRSLGLPEAATFEEFISIQQQRAQQLLANFHNILP